LSERTLFYNLSLQQLAQHMLAWGEPSYRARQIWQAVYRRLLLLPHSMTDLPLDLRQRLAETFLFDSTSIGAIARTEDGSTEKVVLGMSDGHAVEAVLMRYKRRRTACISTQVGCAMGCSFCATGQMGFVRNLSVGEIIEQVLYFARLLAAEEQRLTNIVIMGMGEPFNNYDATLQAIDSLNDPEGFYFGARRFTISTIGVVPMIERFTQEQRQVNLAVSLHAAADDLRQQLIPINRRYPLESLIPACRQYVEVTRRRITFEWALIHGVNDGQDQAQALADLVAGLTCHVNLIPLNPTRGYVGRGAAPTQVEAFRAALTDRGVPCTIRVRRGIDIQAGCGQLATESRDSP
jgi:23S rRNA (adenine2503-C2)-methyltransferase